jgi:hypothetical protein
MAQHRLHGFDREARLDEQAGRGVPQAMHAVFRARRVGRDAGGVLHRAEPAVDVRQALDIARGGREDEPPRRRRIVSTITGSLLCWRR